MTNAGFGEESLADVVARLVDENVAVEQQVIAIDDAKWAVPGHIAYEGEIIAATFPSEGEAWAAIARFSGVSQAGGVSRLQG